VSTQTPTLEHWLDADASEDDVENSAAESRPQWAESAIRCRCGADISQWHTDAESRRLKRAYARTDGRLPACPDCVEYPSGDHRFDTIPHAIRAAEPESTCDRVDHIDLVLREVEG
jgi:hypothetical protein